MEEGAEVSWPATVGAGVGLIGLWGFFLLGLFVPFPFFLDFDLDVEEFLLFFSLIRPPFFPLDAFVVPFPRVEVRMVIIFTTRMF